MAYKIQVGAAHLAGTTIYEGQVDTSDTKAISGSVISGSDDIIVHGAGSGDGANISAGGSITAASASFTETAQWLRMDSDGDGRGRLLLKRDNSGTNTQLAIFKASSVGTGSFALSSTDSADVQLSCEGGTLSGSGEVNLAGNLTISNNGNLTIAGELVVNGTDGKLNVDTFTTTDGIIEIKKASNGNGFGVAFGQTGSVGSGGQILLNTGGDNKFEIKDGGGQFINLSASTFYGDGSSLTGLGSQNTLQSVTSKNSAQTASLGFNHITVGSTSELRLLTGSGLSAGDEIIIKRFDDTTNTLSILHNGTDNIDGEEEIVLESGRAAVSLVYNNSGSFLIF